MQASDEVAGVVTSTSVQLFATMSVTEGAIASPEPLNVERAFSHPLSHAPFRCKRGLHHIMSFFHALANPVLHASHCRLVRLVTALQVLTLVEYLLCIQIPFLYILFPISKSPTFSSSVGCTIHNQSQRTTSFLSHITGSGSVIKRCSL
jgi:hypothetical protein